MAWLKKLLMYIKLGLAYFAGEKAQAATDHNQAVDAANVIGQRIEDAQKDVGTSNPADIADWLRKSGGL